MTNKSGVALLTLISLTFSGPAMSGSEDELNTFHNLCKLYIEVIVSGYELRKAGLAYELVVENMRKTFSNQSQSSKESSDEVLYLVSVAYSLQPKLKNEIIREAAYDLCMKEKLSEDK